jgi:O-antigen ligase
MFLASLPEFIILISSLFALSILSYKRIDLALGTIILALPFYLIRLEIWFVPTTVLELMIYVVFGGWIIKEIREQRIKNKNRKIFHFPIFLIFLGCIISIIVSPDKQTGLGIFKGWFVDPLLLFLIIIHIVKLPSLSFSKLVKVKRGMIIKILSFLAVSGIIVSIVGFLYYLFGELTYDGRLKAFFLSPNHLAMYLVPAGIISFGLFLFFSCHFRPALKRGRNPELKKNRFRIERGMANRYFWLFGFIICSIVIYLTYSYGAWIGFGAALLFLIFFGQEKIIWRKFFSLLIIIGLFLSIIFFFQFNAEKFQNLANSSRSSWESRIMIWKTSLAILKDHPLWGIGPGNFQDFYLDYQKKFPPYLEWAVPQPHNLFLAFYLQCGLFGLIGFFWLILLFFKTSARYLPIADYRLPIATLTAVMIYILIHGLIDTPYWKNDLAVVFWIIIGLMKIIQNSNKN